MTSFFSPIAIASLQKYYMTKDRKGDEQTVNIIDFSVGEFYNESNLDPMEETEMKWQRIKYMPCTPVGDHLVTGSEEHIALSRKTAAEGAVLLKNTDDCLPFAKGTKLAVLGKAQIDYVKVGGGSGDVTTAYQRNLMDGLWSKAAEGKVELFKPLCDYYKENLPETTDVPGSMPELNVPERLLQQAAEFTDTAVLALCRYSSEFGDRTREDYNLKPEELQLLERIAKHFKNCIVCLNVGAILDISPLKENDAVKSILFTWMGGIEGGMAVADLLCGDACPNGRLVDTVVPLDAYIGTENFIAEDAYADYTEDIFVGYRYFETIPGAAEQVIYPFGFGLSYGKFTTEVMNWKEENGKFEVTAKVANIGKHPARHVVQVYGSAPQGKLGKAKKVLVGFGKTKTLNPGESETLSISFDRRELASYDDLGKVCKSAWLLEQGEYRFYVGDNVRDAVLSDFTYAVAEDTVLEQLSPKCQPKLLKQRLLADGTFEALPVDETPVSLPEGQDCLPWDGQQPIEQKWPITFSCWDPNPSVPQLEYVAEGKLTLDAYMEHLDLEQMIHLLGGQQNRGCADTGGIGNLPQFGIPNAMTADGPAGLRIRPNRGGYATAFPSATLLACTWDPETVYAIGKAGAAEVKENNIGIWLTPAVNIHRNPLCGRNFEYYSEDPLITGIMASAMVKGIQSMGIAPSLKHFACNNKEANRKYSDSRVSERALREIYLRGFETCVKTASPWTIMSSYNILNGIRVSENKELLTDILRTEWGYDGVVISDWYGWGVQAAEVAAGNDVKMACGMPEHTLQMVKEGKLSEEAVKTSAKRVLNMLLKLD